MYLYENTGRNKMTKSGAKMQVVAIDRVLCRNARRKEEKEMYFCKIIIITIIDICLKLC